MVNVHDYAHSLARALKESQEYRQYSAARAKVKGKTSAEQMIADLHKRQIELQTQALQGREPTKEQKETLERLFATASAAPDVREYLVAEQRIGQLLNDVYRIIGEAVEIDLPGAQ